MRHTAARQIGAQTLLIQATARFYGLLFVDSLNLVARLLSDFKKCGKELALFGLEALEIPERAERERLLPADTAPRLSLFPASAEPLELCLELLLHNLPLAVIELPRRHLKTAVVARALREDKKCHALHQQSLFAGAAEPEPL